MSGPWYRLCYISICKCLTCRQNEAIGNRFTLIPEITKRKEHLAIRWPITERKLRCEPYNSWASGFGRVSGGGAGVGAQAEPSRADAARSQGEHGRESQQKVNLGRSAAQGSASLQRVPLEYSAECWSVNVRRKLAEAGAHTIPKDWKEGAIADTHTRLGTVPVPL